MPTCAAAEACSTSLPTMPGSSAKKWGPPIAIASINISMRCATWNGNSSRLKAWERRPRPTTTARPLADEAEKRKLIERIRLMFDVAKLAFESDSTRVVSLFINTYSIVPDLPGVTSETHSITHHGDRQEVLDQLFIIESEQIKALAGFLSGLNGIREGGEPLLDRTMVLYGTPMGKCQQPCQPNLPILFAGGGFRHAGHLAFDRQRNYPLPNLFVSMLQRMGIETDRFASSTGTMRGLES